MCIRDSYVTGGGPVLAVLGLALAAWVGMGAIIEWSERVALFRAPWQESWRRARTLPRAAYGMSLAHFGLAVTVAGISASAFAVERIELMHIGQSIPLAGYTLRFDSIGKHDGEDVYKRQPRWRAISPAASSRCAPSAAPSWPIRR